MIHKIVMERSEQTGANKRNETIAAGGNIRNEHFSVSYYLSYIFVYPSLE